MPGAVEGVMKNERADTGNTEAMETFLSLREKPRSVSTTESLPMTVYSSQQYEPMMEQSASEPSTTLVTQLAITTSDPTYQTATATSNYMAAATGGQVQTGNQQPTGQIDINLEEIVSQLRPNQSLALINGQICIVNDDTANSPPVSQPVKPEVIIQPLQPAAHPPGTSAMAPQSDFQVPQSVATTSQNQQVPAETPLLSTVNSANLQALFQQFGTQAIYNMLAQQVAIYTQQAQQQAPGSEELTATTSELPGPSENQNEGFDDLNDDDVEVDGVNGNAVVPKAMKKEKAESNSRGGGKRNAKPVNSEVRGQALRSTRRSSHRLNSGNTS